MMGRCPATLLPTRPSLPTKPADDFDVASLLWPVAGPGRTSVWRRLFCPLAWTQRASPCLRPRERDGTGRLPLLPAADVSPREGGRKVSGKRATCRRLRSDLWEQLESFRREVKILESSKMFWKQGLRGGTGPTLTGKDSGVLRTKGRAEEPPEQGGDHWDGWDHSPRGTVPAGRAPGTPATREGLAPGTLRGQIYPG